MRTREFIPVAAPVLNGNESEYVADCLRSTWISSSGVYCTRFEQEFARFCNTRHALSCSNGTVALHLALRALEIGPGDEVIVPTLTFVATANAVMYCGATPVFVDSEPDTWNMQVSQIPKKITSRTKAIIPVHLYGHPCDMDAILEIARKHGLYVIEDAAEAHGALYKGRIVGSLGDIATFSFFGNKIITTGEGGMVTTNNDAWADRIRLLRGQGMDPKRRYWFIDLGYNYRLTNVAAAIGLAQLEKIQWHLEKRRQVVEWYESRLADCDRLTLQRTKPWAKHAHWMFSVLIRNCNEAQRNAIMQSLLERGIETRPLFYPLHTLPFYKSLTNNESFPIAEQLASQGINLPTWGGLTEEDVTYVCDNLKEVINNMASHPSGAVA